MIHNLVDLVTAVGVLIGLKLSGRKSKAFPYGLYKLENVVTVVLAAMTFLTAYEIARDALFAPPGQATVDPWMLGGVVSATGAVIHGAECYAFYGGLLCEDNSEHDLLGECGCSTAAGRLKSAGTKKGRRPFFR
jgi:Co/Zn/Cd efflux system component